MQDHNLSGIAVKNHGILSVGQSQNTHTPPKILNTERSFAERAVTYVDCWLARNAYTGCRARRWSTQLTAECERRHRALQQIVAARKAFGAEVIPYGLTLPATPIVSIISAVPTSAEAQQ